jgi:hypothetical protein
VAGPPTSSALRAAGWAEALVLLAATPGSGSEHGDGWGTARVRSPEGAEAVATVVLGHDAHVDVQVAAGDPLDEVVLRSYCLGASHMALGWACTEALAVDATGEVHDLTIRSFGILRAADTPPIEVEIVPSDGPPINGSDAVFAAVAAATWLAQARPSTWPTGTRPRTARPTES